MTKEKTKPEDAAQPAAEGQPDKAAKKPSLIKKLMPMLLFGVGGLVLLGGAVYVTLMLMGGQPKADAEAEKKDATADSTKPADSSTHALAVVNPEDHTVASEDHAVASDDSLSAAADSAEAAAELTRNIAAMTDAMAESETSVTEDGATEPMEKNESLKAVDWLDKEQKKLAARESDLTAREQELQKKDREIAQKILKIEQASSDRVTNLAKLYDGMEADAVSKIMANLEDELVVSIIPKMKQKNASSVLALMPPQRAASLSKQIITLASDN